MSFRLTYQNHLDLRCGIVDEIKIGELEPQFASRIGSIHRRDVWLSKECYHHIRTDHDEITDQEIDFLPLLLEIGRIALDTRRDQWLTIDHPFPKHPQHHFLLALKGNHAGDAIYARSLHRLKPRQIPKLVKRGYVLRGAIKKDGVG
jgi:hypothetical protein